MTPALPTLLFPAPARDDEPLLRLPLAELCALQLDGQVTRVGGGFITVDQPDTPWVRAASILPQIPVETIAERLTALWVHGYTTDPPLPAELCVPARGALRAERVRSSTACTVREVVLDPDDVCVLSGLRVTTPLRTAVDLARTRSDFPAELASAVGRMLDEHRLGLGDAEALLSRRGHPTNKRRALQRLDVALVNLR